jgi:mutator protein MutT
VPLKETFTSMDHNNYVEDGMKSVGMAIIVGDKILLTHHPKDKEFKGTFSIPKGRQEQGETDIETAIREVKEEVGITIHPNQLKSINKYDYITPNEGRKIVFFVVQFNFIQSIPMIRNTGTDQLDLKNLQEEEVNYAKFIPIHRAYEFVDPDQKQILDDVTFHLKIKAQVFAYGNDMVKSSLLPVVLAFVDFCYDKLLLNKWKPLTITFEKSKTKEFGHVDLNNKNLDYKITVQSDLGLDLMLRYIAHEITHIAQIEHKDLASKSDGIYFKGQQFPKDVLMYDDYNQHKSLPWEQEAYENQLRFVDEFYTSRQFEDLKETTNDPNLKFLIDHKLFKEGGEVKIEGKNIFEQFINALEPFRNQVAERIVEQMKKEGTTITKWLIEDIKMGLIWDLLKSIGTYLESTDKLVELRHVSTDAGQIIVSATIERDGKEYSYYTEVIYAGGYNIQRLHLRYLTKTTLPKKAKNEEAKKFEKAIGNISKIEKLENENDRFQKEIENKQERIAKALEYSEEDILNEVKKTHFYLFNKKWEDITDPFVLKNNTKESWEEYIQEEIEYYINSWKSFNLRYPKKDIDNYTKAIKKNLEKIEQLRKEQEQFKSEFPTLKYEGGGQVNDPIKEKLEKAFPQVEGMELIGSGKFGSAYLGLLNNEMVVAKYTKSASEYYTTLIAKAKNSDLTAKIFDVQKLSDDFEYGILHEYVSRDGMPNEYVWNLAMYEGSEKRAYEKENQAQLSIVPEKEFQHVTQLAESIKRSLTKEFGTEMDLLQQNFGYNESGKLVLFDIDGNINRPKYEKFLSGESYKEGGEIDDLDNSENGTNFDDNKKINYHVFKRSSGDSKKNLIATTFLHLRRSIEASKKIKNTVASKQQEEQVIKDFCLKNNLLIDTSGLTNFIDEGSENKVYAYGDRHVLKINDLTFYASWTQFFTSLILYNEFFPDTAYELIGFTLQYNDLRPVLLQKYVLIDEGTVADLNLLKERLAADGFSNTRNNDFKNEDLGIILEDLHEENVVVSNGVEFFIDTAMYLIDPIPEKDEFTKGIFFAPNGQKSNLTINQWLIVRTPEFKAWFGDWENDPENASKVVDENGEPLVVYHGTASSFNVFEIGRTRGLFFTNKKSTAERFSQGDLKRIGDTPIVFECFLNIRKIFSKEVFDEKLVDSYYDDYFSKRSFITSSSKKNILKDKYNRFYFDLYSFGIVNTEPKEFLLNNGYDGMKSPSDDNASTYICFHSTQIKLADGTNTTFDPENPDIRFKDGGEILLAPNGKPSNLSSIQYNLVRTPEFKAWFGDWEKDPENASKVVDENGEPLVVYHGTPDARFTVFDKERFHTRSQSPNSKAFFFTPDKEYAKAYSESKNNEFRERAKEVLGHYPKAIEARPHAEEIPCFLNVRKPFYAKNSNLNTLTEANNNDGVFVFTSTTNELFEIAVFEPMQIKLADGRNTTFDPDNPDIYFKGGGYINFDDSEKNNNLDKKTHHEIQFIKDFENLEQINEAISYISRGVESDKAKQSRSLSSKEIEDLEKKHAYDFAVSRDLLITDPSQLPTPIAGGGNENSLYYDDEIAVIFKENNLFNHNLSILEFLKYLVYHNLLFEKNSYYLYGFKVLLNPFNKSSIPSNIFPVVYQRFIVGRPALEHEISELMTGLGFKPVNVHTFENDMFVVSDLRPRNVLVDNEGEVHVIDNIIKVKDSYKQGGKIPTNNFIIEDMKDEVLEKIYAQASEYFSKNVTDDYWHFSTQYYNGNEVTYEIYSEKGGYWLNIQLDGSKALLDTAKLVRIDQDNFEDGGELKAQTIQERFDLPDVTDVKSLDDNIKIILRSYSHRNMAFIQVHSYLEQNSSFAKEWLTQKGISSLEELKKYLSNIQSKERVGISSERKKAADQAKADFFIAEITAQAMSQEEEWQKRIAERDEEESKALNNSKPKRSDMMITMNYPLFIRLLEMAREDIKDDAQLHFVVERIMEMQTDQPLTMKDYEEIIKGIVKEGYKTGGVLNKISSPKGELQINLAEHWMDEMDSSVELVPVSVLQKMREFDRQKENEAGFGSIDRVKNLSESYYEEGIKEPLIIEYSHADKSVLLIEGNHRLNVAENNEIDYLPARVVLRKSSFAPHQQPKAMKVTGAVAKPDGYVSSDLKPSQVGIESVPMFREGGIIEGQLHSECAEPHGCGEKYQVGEGGKVIEAERDEAVIVPSVFNDQTQYRIKGTIAQIASALNVMGEGKVFEAGAEVETLDGKEIDLPDTEAKDTDVDPVIDGGSVIINRTNMLDKNIYEATGTPKQIASQINSLNGNGVSMTTGGSIKKV